MISEVCSKVEDKHRIYNKALMRSNNQDDIDTEDSESNVYPPVFVPCDRDMIHGVLEPEVSWCCV